MSTSKGQADPANSKLARTVLAKWIW